MEKQNEKSENEPDSDLPLLRKETEMSKKKEDILEHHQPSSKRGRGRNKGSAPTKLRLPEFMLPMLESKTTAKDLRKKERLEHQQPSSKRGRGRNKRSAPTKLRFPEFMLPMLERKTTAKDLRKKEGLEHHQPSSSKRGRRRNNRAAPTKQGKIVENKTDSKEKEIVLTRHLHVLLERLPESMLPILERKTAAEDLRKKGELEHHQPSSSKQSTERKPCKPRPMKKIFWQADKVPTRKDRRKYRKIMKKRPFLICFSKEQTESVKSKDSKKSYILCGHDFYIREFIKYLVQLRGSASSNVLDELRQRNLEKELTSMNENFENVINKELVEWIIKRSLNKDVYLEGQWRQITSAAVEAERFVIQARRLGNINRMLSDPTDKEPRNVNTNEFEISASEREKETFKNFQSNLSETSTRRSEKNTSHDGVSEVPKRRIQNRKSLYKNRMLSKRKGQKLRTKSTNKPEVFISEKEKETCINFQSNMSDTKRSEEHTTHNDVSEVPKCNKTEITSRENCISKVEKTIDAKPSHIPCENNEIKILLEECIQLVSQEVLKDDTKLSQENVSPAAEAKTCNETQANLSSAVDSVHGTPGEGGETMKNLKNSSEYDVNLKVNEKGEILPLNGRSLENCDKVQEITFGEHGEMKQKSNLAIDSNTEHLTSNDRCDNLSVENQIPSTSSENCFSKVEKSIDAKPSHIPCENNAIKILLEECIQLVNQDVLPDDTKLSQENVSSVAEAKTCYEIQAHLSSAVDSVHDTSEEGGDALDAEIASHLDSSSVGSFTEANKLYELNNVTPETVVCADIVSPNLAPSHELINEPSQEKNNSSTDTVFTPDERPNDESGEEDDLDESEEYCDGQGCKSCDITLCIKKDKEEQVISFKPVPISDIPKFPESKSKRRTYLQRLMGTRKTSEDHHNEIPQENKMDIAEINEIEREEMDIEKRRNE
ncbi:uncharacterized protein LOC129958624 [Argiope bruennichi]|uniref:uncharacterized protein LOC129958624 n=1 Tax=Argiope bruennichi TaxID=94029 RepID=UPI00249589EA|nr:uncharacterized protein LOC129958624 [Argiope bruennichi]XP_055927199.1 uncharacterized protein LOC129958624 [Argiope bruennichi]